MTETNTRSQVFLATTLLVSLAAAGTAVSSWGFVAHESLGPSLLFVCAGALVAGAAGSWVYTNTLSEHIKRGSLGEVLSQARTVAQTEGIEVDDEEPQDEALINAVRALQENLQSARAKLDHYQRLATVGEFAGALGCELRSPLLRITHHVEELSITKDPDRSSQITWELQTEVDQMCRLVSDLVAFSRVRAPHREPVDLSVLARELAFELPAVEEVKIIIDQSPEAPRAWVDSRQMRTALMNIMRNGVEAMPEGGVMNVRIETSADGRVAIEVRDRGPGIPPEDRQRIFEPLFSTKQGKTGLGMGIARNFIDNNGGLLQVSSAANQGTTVRMELPGTREYPGAVRMVH
jgi:signal transduction histidine kinase